MTTDCINGIGAAPPTVAACSLAKLRLYRALLRGLMVLHSQLSSAVAVRAVQSSPRTVFNISDFFLYSYEMTFIEKRGAYYGHG